MNLSVFDKIILYQNLNWWSVCGPSFCFFPCEKIKMVVLCRYILRLVPGSKKMSYHIYRDNSTQTQILSFAKRQLIITAYSSHTRFFFLRL
jgi:hypothetical protein